MDAGAAGLQDQVADGREEAPPPQSPQNDLRLMEQPRGHQGRGAEGRRQSGAQNGPDVGVSELAHAQREEERQKQRLRQLVHSRGLRMEVEALTPRGAARCSRRGLEKGGRRRPATTASDGSVNAATSSKSAPPQGPRGAPEERAAGCSFAGGGFCTDRRWCSGPAPRRRARPPSFAEHAAVEHARLPHSFYQPRGAPGGPRYSVQNRPRWGRRPEFANLGERTASEYRRALQTVPPGPTAAALNRFRNSFSPKHRKCPVSPSADARFAHKLATAADLWRARRSTSPTLAPGLRIPFRSLAALPPTKRGHWDPEKKHQTSKATQRSDSAFCSTTATAAAAGARTMTTTPSTTTTTTATNYIPLTTSPSTGSTSPHASERDRHSTANNDGGASHYIDIIAHWDTPTNTNTNADSHAHGFPDDHGRSALLPQPRGCHPPAPMPDAQRCITLGALRLQLQRLLDLKASESAPEIHISQPSPASVETKSRAHDGQGRGFLPPLFSPSQPSSVVG